MKLHFNKYYITSDAIKADEIDIKVREKTNSYAHDKIYDAGQVLFGMLER